ncbi:hypothetical protein BJV82DRAFT_597845 [Fennellomyces sp. T-0311]|nr:hypothetical protein BJV82DRAFT_597845 [Fennellomyces sp. T-0311]
MRSNSLHSTRITNSSAHNEATTTQETQLYPTPTARSANTSPESWSDRIEFVEQQRSEGNHRPRSNPVYSSKLDLPSWMVETKASPSPTFDGSGIGSPEYPGGQPTTKYDWRLHSLMLCRHIFSRGLIDGIGSDIAVHVPAWGKVYQLHRLILDQNPYFSLLLQGGFQESSSDSVTLHFENNPFITDDSFYFVLTQLYGKLYDPDINPDNVREILATCSFFQLEHMAELCVQFILQSLDDENVIRYLQFADENMVYGSDRILNAVFTYLCREAYSLPLERVAELPVHWLKKIVESDALWVPSEYDRYKFVTSILDMRHTMFENQDDEDSQQVISDEKDSFVEDIEVVPSPDDLKRSNFEAALPNEDHQLNEDHHLSEELQAYETIISRSIHYVHMTFEQLDAIRSDINPFTGQVLVPDRLLKDALWQQIKLRSKIENASERDTALDLTISTNADDDQDLSHLQLIPSDDMTTYTGESTFLWTTSVLSEAQQKLRPNATKQSGQNTAHTKPSDNTKQYALYPPFRFSVEFTDFATLKHNVRVYSKTIFYAGSNWNMYIQKTRSQRKGVLQLGVYLHRQSIPCGPCNHMIEGATPASPIIEAHQQCPRRCTPELSTFSRYADRRKIVKTWFKIFCPSRGPKHSMTLFQSSPDNFSVLQSWGWRSTTLCADEALSSSHSQRVSGAQHSDDQRSSPPVNESVTTRTTTNTVQQQQPPPRLTRTSSNHVVTNTHHRSENNDSPAATVDVPTGVSTLRFSIVMGHV